MIQIFNTAVTHIMRRRLSGIDAFIKNPHEKQEHVLKQLLTTAKGTEFGAQYAFGDLKTPQDFKNRVPIHTYEQLFPHIERIMHGEKNILWPSHSNWFAKSSGTTNARSKFIPVSTEALTDCHFKAGKDLLSLYVRECPTTRIFSGKGIVIGGSYEANAFDGPSSFNCGDISAVIMKNLPRWAQHIRVPSLDIALMDNWEEKIDLLAAKTLQKNVTNLAGVPTWMALLLQRVLALQGKENLLDIWPNLEVFFYGAVALSPYKNLFKSLIPSDDMLYWNIYNASEGIFGIQDRKNADDLLLMLDHGIFYEFVPLAELDNEAPKALSLDEVELEKDYAMIISTNAGLWRYNIGDTIKFTSLAPYRIRISGRTKHFINVFGEEVVVENAERAIAKACEQTGAVIDNFTVGPIFLEKTKQGRHEWVVEFKVKPSCLNEFTALLDTSLRGINSDYDAKRSFDLALAMPTLHAVKEGTFYNWMKKRGKLGGQNKVPRLNNSRKYVEEILAMKN